MGLCPSRNRNVAEVEKAKARLIEKEKHTIDAPETKFNEEIETEKQPPKASRGMLRADADAYVPLPRGGGEKTGQSAAVVCGEWEQFLSVREEDYKNGTKFRRCTDGTFTSDYQRLLKAVPAHGKPKQTEHASVGPPSSKGQPKGADMDILAAWKDAKDTHAGGAGWAEKGPQGKARRQTALKKTIIAARESQMDTNWILQKKFDEATKRAETKVDQTADHLAMLEELENLDTPRAKDDSFTVSAAMRDAVPFGLADAYACSDTEDARRSNRHFEQKKVKGKTRKYVTRPLSQEVDDACVALLYKLRQLKDAERHMGAQAPKRFKFGLREVQRAVAGKTLKALIVAPDLEVVTSAGGLDEKVTSIMKAAQAKNPPVPLIFGLSRKRLGMALSKSLNISVFAVESTRGAEREVEALFRAARRA